MEPTHIEIVGAREHNLQNVTLRLPRNALVCLTGVSGSGKSTLAFDTLYAEGQRRYVESLSTYARQYIGQLPKPDLDQISGLSPSIAIQQKAGGWNPRSTVGTVTGILDFLRVLWSAAGVQHCPHCQTRVSAMTREQMLHAVMALAGGSGGGGASGESSGMPRRAMILAPLVRRQKGTFADLFSDLLRRGFLRARVDGVECDLSNAPKLQKNTKHDIDLVIDRVTLSESQRGRLAEAIDTGVRTGNGTLEVVSMDQPAAFEPLSLSSKSYCHQHPSQTLVPLSVQLMSFNSPQGACPDCSGLGTAPEISRDKVIGDGHLTLAELVASLGLRGSRAARAVALAEKVRQAPDKPLSQWPPDAVERLWTGQFAPPAKGKGNKPSEDNRAGAIRLADYISDIESLTKLGQTKQGLATGQAAGFEEMLVDWLEEDQLARFVVEVPCRTCHGGRLNPQASSVRFMGRTLVDVCDLSIADAAAWFAQVRVAITGVDAVVAAEPLKEVCLRLQFLLDVGLEYLTLARGAMTLSGGESQRIRLASQIGCGLVGVTYVLDEPSIGLHPRDNGRMIRSLRNLADRGNTVVVVEHDEETMREADYIVDFGPGAGHRGGGVVAEGYWSDIAANPNSLTGAFLSGTRSIPIPPRRPVGPPPK